MKLQLKILLIFIPFLLLSLLGLGLWSFNEAKESTYQSTYRYLSTVLQYYVHDHVRQNYQLLKDAELEQVASYVDSYQQEVAKQAVKISEARGGHIFVVDEFGKSVFSSLNQNSADIEQVWKNQASVVISNGDRTYKGRLENDLSDQVFVAQHFKPWGWVVFYSVSNKETVALVDNILLVTLGVMILCAFGGSVLIYIFSKFMLIRPIETLKKVTLKIAAHETVSSIDIDSKDEIGVLARGIESMSQNIDEYQQELERQHNSLEEIVHNRTKSLIETNEQLKLEVATRLLTEQKLYQSMDDLQESEEGLRTILDSIGDAVIAVDILGNVIRINPVGESMTGWKFEESRGKALTQVFNIRNSITGKVPENPVEKVLATGKTIGLANHTQLISKDGSEYQIADSAAPIMNTRNEITGVVLVFRDVTEEYRIQEELQTMQQLKKIGTLAGGLAHDFNNMLTGLFGNISMAKAELPKDHRSHKYLEESENSMKRATRLTSQLLTFAKGGAPIKQDVSIRKLIEEIVRFDLSGSKVMPIFESQEGLWMVEADKGQMQQVFSNLTINAKQAMLSGGHLTITLENTLITSDGETSVSTGKYVKITIRDEGTGIARQHIERIFDPYFSTKETGSGLGLATTYSIINTHGGSIRADSELGIGTTFVILLPTSKLQSPAVGKKTVAPLAENKNGRILLMDDDQMILEVTSQMLALCGHTVEIAVEGSAAIQMYKQAMEEGSPFDVVIMDLTIPGGIGGKEAILDVLRLDPEAKVIVSSGYAEDPVMANYAEYGFVGVVTKPYSIDQLREVLNRILNRTNADFSFAGFS